MSWETDKVWEYIQNDESVLEKLSNQTDDDIYVSLCKSDEFCQYVFDLFMASVDFEELANNLKDDDYSIELYFLNYCFPHELNDDVATLLKIIIEVDCGFTQYDEGDVEEEKKQIEDEIASELYDRWEVRIKGNIKAIKNFVDNQLSDEVDWLYDEIIQSEITNGKKLYLEVVITKEDQ